MLYDDFKPVVDLVLNNWTALQLAVEHGMGAPGGEKTAQLMSVYVARYCVENVVCVDDLTEYHGNPDDDTTSSGTDDDTDMNGHHQPHHHHQSNGFSEAQASSSQDEPMDEDQDPVEPGWTVVKTRRKK
ncbi:Pre-rRNA-processing protein TSR2-like protein [Operophtera brumata]|uniref:Pre-rRNA-processing protein TSR2 homolog n=1 Tax=Operophtera brumata TaxID=104452 RepID=A0A0L7L009_OPEBR|nr:Pre-rRNA-processing protein TSR2-like protein [Operophtera brumata]